MENENGQNGIATHDIQDVNHYAIINQRRARGLFKNPRWGCLLKLGKEDVFNAEYATQHGGFNTPVLFANHKPSQLGLKVPPRINVSDGTPFSYATVAQLVGPYRSIQVIDTATQLTTEYTLQEWVEYLETPAKERLRILNVITLEFSQTPLGQMVTEPEFARDVDFVKCHWPKTLKDIGLPEVEVVEPKSTITATPSTNGTHNNGNKEKNEKAEDGSSSTKVQSVVEVEDDDDDPLSEILKEEPRVSKYCLMSAAGCYTDFHVDFGGTAVWYHVYTGSKVFYFIKPTPQNLKIYSNWATGNAISSSGSFGGGGGGGGGGSSSKKSSHSSQKQEFLPDLITAQGGEVYEVSLQKGKTLFIPSGWIHAVYTPEDSLVFGGNFVHRHSLEMQLTIYRLERQMKVGKDFKFPNYQKLMWYAARGFLDECNALQVKLPKSANFFDKIRIEQCKVQIISDAYPAHILKGYKVLAKELERWAASKARDTIEQYPENMNVVSIANELGNLMKLCDD